MRKKFNYIILIIVILFVAIACGKSADEYYNEGVEYDEKLDYEKALNSFSLAIKLQPDFAEAYAYRAGTFYSLGDYDSALRDANKAIQINHELASAYNIRGIIYLDKNEFDKAIIDFNKSLTIDSTFAFAYSNRGIAKVNSGKYMEAYNDHSKAILLNSFKGDFFINRGVSLYFMEDYDAAIQDYNKGLKLVSDHRTKLLNFAYVSRGNAYSKAGQKQNALLDFNKSIEVFKHNPNSYYNRGLLLKEFGQIDKACNDWKTGSKFGHEGCQKKIKKYCN